MFWNVFVSDTLKTVVIVLLPPVTELIVQKDNTCNVMPCYKTIVLNESPRRQPKPVSFFTVNTQSTQNPVIIGTVTAVAVTSSAITVAVVAFVRKRCVCACVCVFTCFQLKSVQMAIFFLFSSYDSLNECLNCFYFTNRNQKSNQIKKDCNFIIRYRHYRSFKDVCMD